MSVGAVTETHQEPMAVLPALPDHRHNKGAFKLAAQLDSAGLLSGMGNGYRAADKDGRTESLVVPDFYALHREPRTEDMLTLVSAISLATEGQDDDTQAARLLDIAIDGMRGASLPLRIYGVSAFPSTPTSPRTPATWHIATNDAPFRSPRPSPRRAGRARPSPTPRRTRSTPRPCAYATPAASGTRSPRAPSPP